MKITIFGLTISSSWGNGHATPYRAIVRALHRMGHTVVFYERDVPYYAKRRDFTAADFCELVLYSEWENIRPRALQDACDADVVIHASFCPEGACIIEEVATCTSASRAFYDLDTQVTIENLQAGTCEYLRQEQIPQFDVYFSWCGGRTLEVLEHRWAARRAVPLYGCVDPDVHSRVEVPEPYRCTMSYMGTYAVDRQARVDELFLQVARGRPEDSFVLAGSMYPHGLRWPSNVRRFEHVSPHDHSALYSGSRITLNVTRDTMARDGFCPPGRLFEAAACGTPIVSDWFEGLDSFLSPNEEIFVARGAGDVTRVLELPSPELARVANQARERTLAEHTGQQRAQQLISHLEEAASAKTSVRAEVA